MRQMSPLHRRDGIPAGWAWAAAWQAARWARELSLIHICIADGRTDGIRIRVPVSNDQRLLLFCIYHKWSSSFPMISWSHSSSFLSIAHRVKTVHPGICTKSKAKRGHNQTCPRIFICFFELLLFHDLYPEITGSIVVIISHNL